MKTFSTKVREAIFNAQNGVCGVDGCYERITGFHHIVHNIKYLQKKFPLYLHSPMNCIGVCEKHHKEYTRHKELNSINEDKASVIEEWLWEFKGDK